MSLVLFICIELSLFILVLISIYICCRHRHQTAIAAPVNIDPINSSSPNTAIPALTSIPPADPNTDIDPIGSVATSVQCHEGVSVTLTMTETGDTGLQIETLPSHLLPKSVDPRDPDFVLERGIDTTYVVSLARQNNTMSPSLAPAIYINSMSPCCSLPFDHREHFSCTSVSVSNPCAPYIISSVSNEVLHFKVVPARLDAGTQYADRAVNYAQ